MILLLINPTSAYIYSLTRNLSVTNLTSPQELAHATFLPQLNKTGWNHIHLVASSSLDSASQHFALGFLQGYITQPDIYNAWKNYVQGQLGHPNLPANLQQYVNQQLDFIDNMVEQNPDDLYWQQANCLMQQLRGMHQGYQARITKDHSYGQSISRFYYFYYLANMGDLNDLLPSFTQQKKMSECNLFIKRLGANLLVGHSTFNIYHLMMRYSKVYQFPSKDSRIAATKIAFTSRAGDLSSKDDFYLASSGLVVLQTSLNNYNSSNYKFFNAKTLPCWMRSRLGLRLSRNAQQWVQNFRKYRSGTHNSQWVIVDYHALSNHLSLPAAFLYQQFFGLESSRSLEDWLRTDGYFAGFNVPLDADIYEASNYKQGYGYDYYSDPRYKAFRSKNESIQDIDSLKAVLRTVDPSDLELGIAPRYDLLERPTLFGSIDSKVIDIGLFENQVFWAVSGPAFSGDIKPFDWRNWPNKSRHGFPDVWDFGWKRVDWSSSKGVRSLDK